MKRYWNDLASLFFPDTCAGCDASLLHGERLICTACWYHLPYTQTHQDLHNEGARQLWGRVALAGVASYLYFRETSRVQRILHRFKYQNCPLIGTELGRRYGEILKGKQPFSEADVIVPVPLHDKRRRKRGYNQSTYFAAGLSETMEIPVEEKGLVRLKDTESQTRKNRYERYENLMESFALSGTASLAGKHVLLVDDVMTTGATLEACANVLETHGTSAISVATIAKAR